MDASTDVAAPRLPWAEALLVAANRWAIIAMMGTMALLVFANVVSRYLFNHSLVWVEELTQYQMIWIAWLGAGLALREGRHVAVDLLEDALPERARRILRGAIALTMLAFLLALGWYGTQIVAFSWNQETPMLGIHGHSLPRHPDRGAAVRAAPGAVLPRLRRAALRARRAVRRGGGLT
ncbi:MAG: TRAP transporter small permease [Burkholderiaceae bacterium]